MMLYICLKPKCHLPYSPHSFLFRFPTQHEKPPAVSRIWMYNIYLLKGHGRSKKAPPHTSRVCHYHTSVLEGLSSDATADIQVKVAMCLQKGLVYECEANSKLSSPSTIHETMPPFCPASYCIHSLQICKFDLTSSENMQNSYNINASGRHNLS